jgi:hypothetical protein
MAVALRLEKMHSAMATLKTLPVEAERSLWTKHWSSWQQLHASTQGQVETGADALTILPRKEGA